MLSTNSNPRCWVEIDLSALERNLKRIRAALPPHLRYVAVVKADAYGHGMRHVVSRLMHSGADMFAVANLREAAEVREIGSGWPILVLSAILPHEDQQIAEIGVIPTISTTDEVERFARVAQKAGHPVACHLKIDTGMGRAGVWWEEARPLYEKLRATEGLQLDGVFTHFSSADGDPDYTRLQRDRFLQTLDTLPHLDDAPRLIHADNSAGLESFPREGRLNGARVGLLQFGVLPYPDSLLRGVEVEPVLSFHTRVGLVKTLPAGTSVSYGRTCTLEKQTRIAVLAAGYGDGLPLPLSNRGEVLLHGERCRILGRVSMDQTVIDASNVSQVQPGDQATLIGTQQNARIDVTEFARLAESIPWEVFTSITKRVQRLYKVDTAL